MFFRIRKFRITDYRDLIKLWHESELSCRIKGRDSQKEINRQIKLKQVNLLVAEKDQRLIGSILATHDGRRGWINRLAVSPKYREQGIAKQLVKQAEQWFKKEKINIICALIEDENRRSMNFIQGVGYKKHNDIVYFSKRKSRQT